MSFSLVRGTKDILPDEIACWHEIEELCREFFDRYNFQELRTPIFEQTDLFNHGIGIQSEIVQKEMYSFTDRSGRHLTLRPEGTASIVRSFIQHQLHNQYKSLKLYYQGPMFRYERPQAGRYRQFHQVGVEHLGSSSPYSDAELISMSFRLFSELGLTSLKVHINSIGCKTSRPVIEEMIRQFIGDNFSKLPDYYQKRFKNNPLRILDSKDENVQALFSGIPSVIDILSQKSKDHFYSVLTYLDELGIQYKIKPTLVRGLDYYNDTVFEIVSDELGAQNAVCGGGRYDNLIKQLGGPRCPAVGFAFGMERLVMLMNKFVETKKHQLDIYLIPLGETQRTRCFKLQDKLRQVGVKCDFNLEDNLKNGLKRANKLRAKFALIYGEDESEKNIVILKHMKSGSQEELIWNNLGEVLKQYCV